MKDLKENIQKNNMKKLVLSAVLGVFCYCTNNATEQEEEEPQIVIENIIDVLGNMIEAQVNIFKAKEAIKEKGKNIYATIKDKNGKVTKESLLNFFKKQFAITDEELFNLGIENLEQYFHLKGENDKYECTKDNLTEIFWEEKEGGETIDGVEEDITDYLIQIASSEDIIYECFTRYYCIKKAEKTKEGEVENVEDMIIEEITNECCEGDKESKIHARFLAKLEKLCEKEEKLKELLKEEFKEQLKEYLKDKKEAIIEAIQRRITLDKEITKENLKSFIKQKIGIEEKKENKPEEKKNFPKGNHPEEEGGCHCCNDCCGKKG